MNIDFETAKSLWPYTSYDNWMVEDGIQGLVSVIIPTYNRAEYLRNAIDSVATQTYRPIELLLIDDGSTDHTRKLVEDFAAEYENDDFVVRYIQQENAGAPAARNHGLIECQGQYIHFLDSDDYIAPHKTGTLLSGMEDKNPFLFTFGGRILLLSDSNGNIVATEHERVFPDTDTFIRAYKTNVHNAIFHRHLLYMSGPWQESLPCGQDIEYMARIWLIGGRGRVVQTKPVQYTRSHKGDRVSRKHKNWRNNVPLAYAFAKNIKDFKINDPKITDIVVRQFFGLARLAYTAGVFEEASHLLKQASAMPKSRSSAFRIMLFRTTKFHLGSRFAAKVDKMLVRCVLFVGIKYKSIIKRNAR